MKRFKIVLHARIASLHDFTNSFIVIVSTSNILIIFCCCPLLRGPGHIFKPQRHIWQDNWLPTPETSNNYGMSWILILELKIVVFSRSNTHQIFYNLSSIFSGASYHCSDEVLYHTYAAFSRYGHIYGDMGQS